MVNRKRGKLLIFNGKKGVSHDLFFNVFELVLAFIVVLALLDFVGDVADQTIFKKNYLARDISLLVNALYAAPVKVEYNYVEDISRFVLDFSEGRISIYENDEESEIKTFYLFGENKDAPFPTPYPVLGVDEGARINFLKLESSMSVERSD
tara:strand:+ start:6068 stop:6520 length:453 start_codon:yes stop_codon:yes gene_type:complete